MFRQIRRQDVARLRLGYPDQHVYAVHTHMPNLVCFSENHFDRPMTMYMTYCYYCMTVMNTDC